MPFTTSPPHLELVSEDVGVGIVRCVRVCRQRLLIETMMNDHVDDDQRKVQDGDDHDDLDDWFACRKYKPEQTLRRTAGQARPQGTLGTCGLSDQDAGSDC